MTSVRELSSDQDWADYLHFHNMALDHGPLTLEQLREIATHGPADMSKRRVLLLHDNVPVGSSVATEAVWYAGSKRFEMRVFPGTGPGSAARFGELVDLQSDWAVSLGARKIGIWGQSRRQEELEELVDRGFVEGQRNQELALDVREFDWSAWDATLARIDLNGTTVCSYAQAMKTDPEWEHKAWRMEMDVMADVPLPEPFKETPFDDFKKMLHDPTLCHESSFCAMRDGQWVGLSQIHPNRVDPRLATTGITGVARSHRRQGLATVLKLRCLKWAAEHGVERVGTDNEEGNPMKALNDRLGFKPVFDWIEMTRDVAPG